MPAAHPPFTVKREGDVLVISGAIDETARLVSLVDGAAPGRMILDLHGVTFINSIGVRESKRWI